MAEELDDNRFKKEVMNLLGKLINKAEAHTARFDSVDQKLEGLDRKVEFVSGQLNDVTEKVISHEKRLRSLEGERTPSPGVI